MSDLANKECTPCHSKTPPMTDEEMQKWLADLPNWDLREVEGIPRLVRVFRLKNFRQAQALANRIGDLAEAHGHHPALLVEWGRLTVSWWTHNIGGLHLNDFIMAARSDEAAAADPD